MGRIRRMLKVDGRECWTLFDTGARNTYVVSTVADLLTTSKIPHPIRSAIAGELKQWGRGFSYQNTTYKAAKAIAPISHQNQMLVNQCAA